MRKIDPFAYVNQYYGLSLKKHSPVVLISGERGQVSYTIGPDPRPYPFPS